MICREENTQASIQGFEPLVSGSPNSTARLPSLNTCLKGLQKGILQTPDANIVEVEAVRHAGLQCLNFEGLLGNRGQDLVDLVFMHLLTPS